MRMFPYFYVVVAAGGLVLGAVEAKALTNTAPAGLRAGVETVDLVNRCIVGSTGMAIVMATAGAAVAVFGLSLPLLAAA
jgi:hypothetical protein